VHAARDGSVWVGTLDGLSRWNRGQVTTYRTPGNESTRPGQREAESGISAKVTIGEAV
jgi:ligand-binding sensor domain-containing protein